VIGSFCIQRIKGESKGAVAIADDNFKKVLFFMLLFFPSYRICIEQEQEAVSEIGWFYLSAFSFAVWLISVL
jgi:hypothetical protein